jgi:hypothetical protein
VTCQCSDLPPGFPLALQNPQRKLLAMMLHRPSVRTKTATLTLLVALATPTASAQTAKAESASEQSQAQAEVPVQPDSFVVDVTSTKPETRFDLLRAENIGHTLCKAPCRAPVYPQSSYQVWGPSMVKSSPFQVPPGTKLLAIDPGSSSTRDAGFIVGYIGFSLVVPGLLTLGTGALVESVSTGSGLAKGFLLTGGGLTGVGLITTLLGLALVLTTSTSVTTDRGETIARNNTRPLKKPSMLQLRPTGLVW